MNTKHWIASRKTAGFSLIEVLIALVILSVGLLGIAAMVSVSLKSKDSSYMRTQATAESSAILDRMRANRATATSGGYDIAIGSSITSPPNCFGSNPCTPAQIASIDVAQWKSDLASLLPSGDGSISTVINNQMTQVTITIQWNDQRANQANNSSAPPAGTVTFAMTSGI